MSTSGWGRGDRLGEAGPSSRPSLDRHTSSNSLKKTTGSLNAPSGSSRKSTPTIYAVDSDDDSTYTGRENNNGAFPARSINGVKKEKTVNEDGYTAKGAIRAELSKLDAEIRSIEDQLQPLQALHASLTADRRRLETQLSTASRPAPSNAPSTSKARSSGLTDYQSSFFPWSPAAKSALKSVFGLGSFRLCQEGVINAAMDGRDIVCVMPTGGGKSLTYQLPAVAGARGLTLVISPLLALIWDQVRALKELGIESAMFTGSTPKAEQNILYQRIEEGEGRGGKELRICYVTPEKIAKSKRLMSVLEKANSAGRLKRFVIDEAHCCSQLGHDFRPDYKKLSVLKTLFPRVPIQAVTATLSSKTMPDLLKILRLPPITDGRSANSSGTVFFSAPLFRPNLHYRVLSKPSSAKAAIEKIGIWIKEHHLGKSGIIYCFSKKDAETIAESLTEWSKGEIRSGVYHAGIDDWEKEQIHLNWRKGKVNCICATIAFGLGIDKGDVRYVIHHSMSKSLDGYYQETGRAGRDGVESDCVLFYRGQDASRLSSMVYGDVDGEMLRFAQDLKTCRKVAFAKYFSTSSHLSAAAWDNADTLKGSGGTISTCGICDNCTRDPSSIITKDVTVEAWKILKVLEEVVRTGGRATIANLSDLARGLGGGSFNVPAKDKGRKRQFTAGEKQILNLDELVEGKISLNKDDTEALMIHLTLLGYLEDSYSATAYSVNVYVNPGRNALRLSRRSLKDVKIGTNTTVECTFHNPKAGVVPKRKSAGKKELVILSDHEGPGRLKKEEVEDEVEDLRDLVGWDDDEEEMEEVAGIERYDAEEDDPDDWIGEVDNGWKVVGGERSAVGRKLDGVKGVSGDGSKKRAIVLSDSD